MNYFINISAYGWKQDQKVNFTIRRWVEDMDDIDTIWKEASDHAAHWGIEFGGVASINECSDYRL